MSKHMLKSFVVGFASAILILSTGTVFAESIEKTINAVFGKVKVTVNGKAIDSETLLYDGRTYLPLRAAADALGMDLKWDERTSTANLAYKTQSDNTPPISTNTTPKTGQASQYSKNNPAPMDTTVRYTKLSGNTKFGMDIKIEKIIKGDDAWEVIKLLTDNPVKPETDYEYMAIKLKFDVKEINTNEQLSVQWYDFNAFSDDGTEYERIYKNVPRPELNFLLNKGESDSGYILFMAKKDDKPVLQYDKNPNGSGGVWFKLYDEDEKK